MSDNVKKQVTVAQATEMLKNTLGLSDKEVAELDNDLLNELAADMGLEVIPAPVEEATEPEVEQAEETVEPFTEEVEKEPEQAEETTEEPTEEVAEEETVEAHAEEVTEEATGQPAEQVTEEITEEPAEQVTTGEQVETVEEAEQPASPAEEEITATEAPAEGQTASPAEEQTASPAEEATKKEVFKLTAPENNDELMAAMCTKRGRKLIYAPKEVIYENTFTVLGTDKKNDEGIKIKDIIDAEIKVGEKLGYLQKYDGLKTSEIKEEYENDVVYEYAEQEFKKAGLIYDGKKIKVYLYDWDGKAVHHVGYIDEKLAADAVKYLADKENYSFALNAIITGGKGKRVIKDEATGKITIEKIKDGVVGLELDVNVLKRKD